MANHEYLCKQIEKKETLKEDEAPEKELRLCEELMYDLSKNDLYLALQEAFIVSKEAGFKKFLEDLLGDLGEIQLTSGNKENTRRAKNLSGAIKDVLTDFCGQNEHYYKPEIDQYINTTKPSIKRQSKNFYGRLGLKEEKISRPAELFVELAMRRELAINNWIDKAQEFIAKHIAVLPERSIGPLEIRPATYLRALLVKNSIEPGKNYEENLKLAKKHKLIIRESQLTYRILQPSQALQAFEDILSMYMTKSGKPVEVFLRKEGKIKNYLVPVQSSYTFSTKKGEIVNYTYDELRLMAALAKYQGLGLRFLSPDEEVQIKDDHVVLNKRLVLNNIVTEICVG